MDIVRFWKDPDYRRSLSAEDAANAGAHPAGIVELDDLTAAAVAGGNTEAMASMGCCGGITNADTVCRTTGCGCTSAISDCQCTGAMATCGACTA